MSFPTPQPAEGSTIEERVFRTLRAAEPAPVPFCQLARHCAGYEHDCQMHAIVCERIIQLAKEGRVVIDDRSSGQDDIYAPVSLPPPPETPPRPDVEAGSAPTQEAVLLPCTEEDLAFLDWLRSVNGVILRHAGRATVWAGENQCPHAFSESAFDRLRQCAQLVRALPPEVPPHSEFWKPVAR